MEEKVELSISVEFLLIHRFFQEFLPEKIRKDGDGYEYTFENEDLIGLPLAGKDIMNFLNENLDLLPEEIKKAPEEIHCLAIWFLREPFKCKEHQNCSHPYALLRGGSKEWEITTYYGPCWGDFTHLGNYGDLHKDTYVAVIR